jgi:signal transduction histidine kinase
MDTYFASAKRASEKELTMEIEIVSKNPIVQGLLHLVSGSLAVLDTHRQIVALNDSFLQLLGIDNPGKALGLRTGEAVQCIHSHEAPNGCGTTKFCRTCGTAVAIVACLTQDMSMSRICALTAKRGGVTINIALLVQSRPIKINEKAFLLLFLQDITLQQQRAALERSFFHDINNILSGLIGASELLSIENSSSDLAKTVYMSALCLSREIAIQKCLFVTELCEYQLLWCEITIEQIINTLKNIYANHPAACGKKLHLPESFPAVTVKTDITLVLRVMCNMITNALEATRKNGAVKVWLERSKKFIVFCVWNRNVISEDVARRIFQRNFSTKEDDGRGIGTYSMKLFGEKYLGGKVSFTSSEKGGTVFRFSLPC